MEKRNNNMDEIAAENISKFSEKSLRKTLTVMLFNAVFSYLGVYSGVNSVCNIRGFT